jgi:small-conductance mechanosensitive channel
MADGLLQSGSLPIKLTAISSDLIVEVILVIVIAYVMVRIMSFLLTHLAERIPYHRIQIMMAIPFVKILLYMGAVYIIATSIVRPDVAELVAFFGVFGAILAFGVKDLFTDIVGGFVIVLEKPFQIGDKVSLGGHYGEVADIGLRSTRLMTPDESLVSVPNYNIFNQAITSSNAGSLVMLVVTDLHIDSRCNGERAIRIARDAAVTSKFVTVSKRYPCSVIYTDFPLYHQVRVKAYVSDIRNEFLFKSDITRRAWKELRRQGILPSRVPFVIDENTA